MHLFADVTMCASHNCEFINELDMLSFRKCCDRPITAPTHAVSPGGELGTHSGQSDTKDLLDDVFSACARY